MLLGERPPVTSEGDTLRVAGCKQAFLFVHEQNQRALAIAPMDSIRESDFRGTALREVRLVKDL